jgi:exodeoxyribonuclease V alpha subunit
MDSLTGSVERITFYNPENGYTVLRLHVEKGAGKLPGRSDMVTVTGNLPEMSAGEYLRLQGKWVKHPRHGLQFQSEICDLSQPATLAGIQRYLGSGLIKGIGPRLAERIVSRFGEQTLDIIENQPEKLVEVADIGPKRLSKIAQAWQEQKQVKEIMLFLHSYGVSTNLAIKIYKHYGAQALGVVQSDPYRLAQDIYGVGFKTADKLAQAIGLAREHPSRIEAGVVFAMNELVNEGHTFAPQENLLKKAINLLEVPPELVQAALDRLVCEERLSEDHLPFLSESSLENLEQKQVVYYLPAFFFCEVGIAERIQVLATALPSRLSDLPPLFIQLEGLLSEEQQAAIWMTLNHPLSILTGGPGTGKTTCLKSLIALMDENHKRYALVSPTGRAAKRLSEATGRPASTIHRLLGYSPGEGFKYNEQHPLDLDLLVVDEASMIDLMLMHNLLKALKMGTHLLLVGDVDQLPSVGAGDVLRDLIASEVAPVTRLSVIFRQAQGSSIITNAHRINQGEMPIFPADKTDFFLFPVDKPEDAADWVQEVVCERMPRKFGLHARDQIQVLVPMYRGAVGVNTLNDRLQAVLNPPAAQKTEKVLFGQVFRVGDKVMQLQNNYEKDVFNGDIGWVVKIDLDEQELDVKFEGKQVSFDWSEADQLTLAYAISVHKSQGSEFTAVVIPVVTAHYLMLQRNLLYTAITRARQMCVLVGSNRAIAIAVRNDQVSKRYSALKWRLQTR